MGVCVGRWVGWMYVLISIHVVCNVRSLLTRCSLLFIWDHLKCILCTHYTLYLLYVYEVEKVNWWCDWYSARASVQCWCSIGWKLIRTPIERYLFFLLIFTSEPKLHQIDAIKYHSYFIEILSLLIIPFDNLSNGLPFEVSCSIENSLTSTEGYQLLYRSEHYLCLLYQTDRVYFNPLDDLRYTYTQTQTHAAKSWQTV